MKSQTAHSDKVAIIGSGVGGLSTAVILAKLGYDVTVFEKNRQPGGLMRSYRRGGIACEVGVHYLGSLDRGQVLRRFFDYLGVSDAISVTRMGEDGIIDRYLFEPSGDQPVLFDLPPGLDRFAENLRQAFPREQETISRIVAPIRIAARQLHSLDLLYSAGNDFSLLDHAQPLGEIFDDLNVSPRLRSVLAIPSCWLGVPLQDCPAYYHNMALASYVSSSWRLACSGADMADVFVARLRQLGGTIRIGVEVNRIRVSSRSVTGLQLDNGEDVAAATVIGAVHPKIVLQMLPLTGAVRPSYRQRITGIEDTHGIFSVHASVDAAVHPEIPHNIFKVDTDERGNVPDLRYYQIRKSERAGSSLLSILTSGRDELWAPWAGTKTGRRGDDYRQVKLDLARELIREAETIFGPFKELKILDAYTPLTMRDWVNAPGGSAYGVQRCASQMLATALLNRTSVKGLCLAGQSVMAPGIIGTIMGSFSTVRLLLGQEEFAKKVQL